MEHTALKKQFGQFEINLSLCFIGSSQSMTARLLGHNSDDHLSG